MKIIPAILISSAFLSLLSGCKNSETAVLDDNHITERPLWDDRPEKVILTPPGKTLFDFKSPIYSFWTANDKISLLKTNEDALRVDIKEAGQAYDCWGTEFKMPYDFSEKQVLKVTVRMEGNLSPNLSIQLKDFEGTATNLNAPIQRIRKSPDYMDYYFSFENRWKQIWPSSGKVDQTQVKEILFFVNPGKMNWTGTLFIDKIETLSVAEMPSKDEIRHQRREQKM